ncbi:ureidoglycolate dehydrogenase, partial [Salmonella enterica subsp. enterica serovar Rubislaw]|uniref:Ldh family oxidoreductase n=1 Tax=Salmonella enterica TaxID=28901 RepID=UPI000D610CF0
METVALNKHNQQGLERQREEQVADLFVHADITGVHSHGVIRVEHYCTRLNAGGLNPKATFSIEQISPSVAILDSDDGMGHCALLKATDHAISLPGETGLGFASGKKTSHCGAVSGCYEQGKPRERGGLP